MGLVTCKPSPPEYYVRMLKIDYGIEHLSEAKIEYFYENIEGMDSAGIYYYVLKFEAKPINFFKQFENQNSKPPAGGYEEPDRTFKEGKNEDFEEKVDTLLNTFMRDDYYNLDDQYKIDWNNEYLYKNDMPNYVIFPMIYFVNNFRLFIVIHQS
jgi:hypothetical protein